MKNRTKFKTAQRVKRKKQFGSQTASYRRQSSEWAKPSWSLPIGKEEIKGRFLDDPIAIKYDF